VGGRGLESIIGIILARLLVRALSVVRGDLPTTAGLFLRGAAELSWTFAPAVP